MKDTQNIQQLWTELKTNGDRYKTVWDDISKYTGITVDPNYIWTNNESKKSEAADEFVDDPTSALSVNQAGDYLIGIMWGTGDKAFDIVPSRYVLELADKAELEEWYSFATDQTLYHMNHAEAGFHTALRPYAYDQAAFGNAGIGCFLNKEFMNKRADNALIFMNYGVDNTRIDEGKSGVCEIVFCIYHWRVNRIVGEFALDDKGDVDEAKLAKLPKPIKDAYAKSDLNKEFDIVFGFFPRDDFNPSLKGKRGTKYRGVWFMDGANDNEVFYEEDFHEKPIAFCRQIKVRGEVYGRSSTTLIISTIRAQNFIVGTVIEILEKMSNPSLGMFNNAIFGDSVLDTSPNGLTVFNSAMMGTTNPLFPLHDVGDPSAIIQFLIPYFNEKIITAAKIDALLDFASAKQMTATESLQRYAIRGKSLSGMLQQQKIECLEPTCKRSVSVLFAIGELGVDPVKEEQRAALLRQRHKQNRIIPQAVLDTIRAGRPWYELKFNNELEKLTRTEAVQNILQILNSIAAIAGMYPDIIEAVDWYKLLKDINDNLDYNNQILISADEFKEKIAALAQMKKQAMMLQAGTAGAQIQKDTAAANKHNADAQNAGK